MVNAVKRLTNIRGNNGSPRRRFLLIEALSNCSDDRKKSSRRRPKRPKAMLIIRQDKRVVAVGKEKFLHNLNARREKRNRAITVSQARRLPRFKDWKYQSFLPDRRDVGPAYRKVKQIRQILESLRSKVFKVKMG